MILPLLRNTKRNIFTIFYNRIDSFIFLLIHSYYKPKKWDCMRSLDIFDVINLFKYTLIWRMK